MLKLLFEWFDTHTPAYWVIAAIPTLVLLGWAALPVWRKAEPNGHKREGLFALLILTVLIAWRWPFLLSADEYNPDESQLIAGAISLGVDPVPWRSVDGTTSGPLNFFPLLPLQRLGLPLDYFSARLIALLLIWAALLACYRLLRSRFDFTIARLSIVPGLAFFSTVTHPDFVHYSSEQVALLFIALSVFCLLRPKLAGSSSEFRDLFGCFVAGMLPWAKLQSAPLAAALVILAMLLVTTDRALSRAAKWRAGIQRVLAATMPTVLGLAVVAGTGQSEHFFRSYVLQNFAYAREGASSPLPELWNAGLGTGHFPCFVIISLLAVIAGLVATLRSRGQLISFFVGGGLVAASALCVLAPKRAFLHYVLLSIVPLMIWSGNGLGHWWSSASQRGRFWIGFVVLTLGGLVPFGLRTLQPVPEIFGSFLNHWTEPHTLLANTIKRYGAPGSRLAIWGWLPDLHVQTGFAQGTRDGNTYWAIMPSPQREYFRQRFLGDLTRNQPALFVDAVGRDSHFFSDRTREGHENFAPLADYIGQHYQLVLDVDYARLYARRGLDPKPRPHESPSHPRSPTEHSHVIESLHLESISPASLPQWRMRTGFVQMMHPPAQIFWSLDSLTREIIVEYGLAPEAYRHARSDGVELIFELHSQGVPIRHLFHRYLDPVPQPADRGAQLLRIVLPPFQPGAQLVARATVGHSGNGAWDWLYLGRVSPVRMSSYSPAQFPRFNRVPNSAEAEFAYLFKEHHEDSLLLHAPALLTYTLDGKERRLRFDYGFREGAYSNGGQTDGATFLVEVLRPDRPPEILFSRRLAPTSESADRGNHSADVPLLEIAAGTKLVIRIDPGQGNAWDWTYMTDFILK